MKKEIGGWWLSKKLIFAKKINLMNKRKRHLLIGGASILLGIILPYIFEGDFIDFLSGAFIGAGTVFGLGFFLRNEK